MLAEQVGYLENICPKGVGTRLCLCDTWDLFQWAVTSTQLPPCKEQDIQNEMFSPFEQYMSVHKRHNKQNEHVQNMQNKQNKHDIHQTSKGVLNNVSLDH
jgi:hypothetical protein